jgi:hypothetical protein
MSRFQNKHKYEMKPSHIDFSHPTLQRALLRMSIWRWIFVVLSCTSLTFVSMLIYRDNLAQRDAQKTMEQFRSAFLRSSVVIPQPTIPEAQVTAINSAIMQLNLPWSDLLDALEAATPANIALLNIEPDAKKGLLKIQAEAAHSEAMIAYIEILKRQTSFTDVYISKHEIYEQDIQKPLRFFVEAKWRKGEQ